MGGDGDRPVAGAVCYWASVILKTRLGYDDSLDVFGVHGVGGILGTILTGVFATKPINDVAKGQAVGLVDGHGGQVLTQLYGVLAVGAFSRRRDLDHPQDRRRPGRPARHARRGDRGPRHRPARRAGAMTRFTLATVVLLAAGGPAAAQSEEEIWKMCFGPTTDRTVWACTTIIDAKDTTPRNLAIAYRNRGLGYRARREHDPAMADFEQSICTDPSYVESYISRGNVCMDRDQPDLALRDFETALRLRPDYTYALHSRGNALQAKGEFERSMRDYDAALRVDPQFVASYVSRCWSEVALDRLEPAVADCTEALRLRPNFTNAFNGRGAAWLKLGQPAKAVADFEATLRLVHEQSLALYGRGVARQRAGDRVRGDADVARARQLEPGVADRFRHYWRLDL